MKLFAPRAIGFLLFLPASSDAEWEMVWNDEFDAPTINLSKWTHEVNAWGGGNNELQYYTARPLNSRIENGNLVIEAHKEQFSAAEGTRDYTSARLNTRYKGDWLYGRVEVRAKLPAGQGLWPAIWMLPTDWEYGGWAASGEIDIMEMRGDAPTELLNTIHYGAPWPDNTYTGGETTTADLTADFNVYSIEWEPEEIRWYLNGEETWRTSDWFSTNGEYPAPFDKRFHLILNVAVGGNFLTDPDPGADYFPQRMEVDYVRVYQQAGAEQAPWGGSPALLPGRIEAEEYDTGGSNVSWFDTTPENIGGAYRSGDEVDIGPSNDTDGTFSIGWNGSGEWTEYTVESAGGTFDALIRHASAEAAADLMLTVTQEQRVFDQQTVSLPGTGGWTNWQTFGPFELSFPQGPSVLRIQTPVEPMNLNWIEFSARQAEPVSDSWRIR